MSALEATGVVGRKSLLLWLIAEGGLLILICGCCHYEYNMKSPE
jgi:hypothetical protein